MLCLVKTAPSCSVCKKPGVLRSQNVLVRVKSWDVPLLADLPMCATKTCRNYQQAISKLAVAQLWKTLQQRAKTKLATEPLVTVEVTVHEKSPKIPAWWPQAPHTGHAHWVQVDENLAWAATHALDSSWAVPKCSVPSLKAQWLDYYIHCEEPACSAEHLNTRWQFRTRLQVKKHKQNKKSKKTGRS